MQLLKGFWVYIRGIMNNYRFFLAYLASLVFSYAVYRAGDEIGRGLAALAAGTAVQGERAVAASFEAQRALMNEQLQQLRRNRPVEPGTDG